MKQKKLTQKASIEDILKKLNRTKKAKYAGERYKTIPVLGKR